MRRFKPALLLVGIILTVRMGAASETPDLEPSDGPRALQRRPVAEPGAPVKGADLCTRREIESNSMSPTWDIQASTVQCGVLETDNLITIQPVGHGISQKTVTSVAKYGWSPRFEVRWSFPGRIVQSGAGSPRQFGIADEWFGVLYHFHDQGRRTPDLAIDYALKLPTANPGKGFGSGYIDHLLTFVCSREVGSYHFDFNAVGTLAGTRQGHYAAAQFGLALSHLYSKRLIAAVEAFGGPQPGTADRYGAGFVGASWALRPWLALNGGYVRPFTAPVSQGQLLIGFIYTVRPSFRPPNREHFRKRLWR